MQRKGRQISEAPEGERTEKRRGSRSRSRSAAPDPDQGHRERSRKRGRQLSPARARSRSRYRQATITFLVQFMFLVCSSCQFTRGFGGEILNLGQSVDILGYAELQTVFSPVGFHWPGPLLYPTKLLI